MMSIILFFLIVIIVLFIWFVTRVIIEIYKPRLPQEKVNSIVLRVFGALLLLIAAEQIFLSAVVNPAIVRNDVEFRKIIDTVKAQPGGLGDERLGYCEKRTAAIIYQYQICLMGGYRDKNTHEIVASLELYYPHGLLSIRSFAWVNDWLWPQQDHLMNISASGTILSDLRRKK